MRSLTRTLAIAIGMSVFATAPAFAASAEKIEWKETKKDLKTISKYTKKYRKAIDKGKTDKYDADIIEWAKNELQDLRGMGVKTKAPEDPKPTHPAEGGGGAAPEPDKSDTPWLDELAEVLKDVRDKKVPEKRLKAMEKAEQMYTTWEQRRKKKLG